MQNKSCGQGCSTGQQQQEARRETGWEQQELGCSMTEDKPGTKSETAGDKAGRKATAQAGAPAMKPGWRWSVHNVVQVRRAEVKRSSWAMGPRCGWS